jgi:hypothetical protein
MSAGGTTFCFRCVSEIVYKCFICMLCMLQVYISSVSVVSYACFMRFVCMFYVFHLVVAKGSDVAYVVMATHVCFTCFIYFGRMFQMFRLFQTHGSCVSFRCCNDYTNMLQYVLQVATVRRMLQRRRDVRTGEEVWPRQSAAEDRGAAGMAL